jgi:hypothetical protein
MGLTSETCVSKQSGNPLREYDSEGEAMEGAEYALYKYGTKVAPYQCRRCGGWHLSPKDRQTPSRPCDWCRGRDGRSKALYTSEQSALRRAAILRKEQGVHLRAYACPHSDGWHLTKT